mmetsp:Transcript_44879/g.105290  ORF Transcript_44879/g.105290 Transcript_44879/m.105290 type:complete len:125 (-) Transcript_44879:154-528(-)|eukprot:CAMPEP_0177719042 /NCGR_PEP_ID=MMETSP0484_2-20121128/15897_1 /TAXON_ID=354590 /ORGANISM="Rhodomonas lens, Strain RHODO" /LENGTH=124 /DNA_ID=CAMNT_0019231243 /DNA_START=21 /DNA_END=395 /DNA_ORIENTATION=+
MSSDEEDEDPRFGEVIAAVQRNLGDKAGRTVTLAELARHRTERDLWVNIGGHVIDISSFLTGTGKRHPGGNRILTNLIAKMDDDHDVTASFKKFHYPSGNGVKWIKDMYIGVLKIPEEGGEEGT